MGCKIAHVINYLTKNLPTEDIYFYHTNNVK